MFLVDTNVFLEILLRQDKKMPNVKLLSLPMKLYREIVDVRKSLNLDFDDAYQYSTAKYYGLRVATRDKDFERIRDVEILFL